MIKYTSGPTVRGNWQLCNCLATSENVWEANYMYSMCMFFIDCPVPLQLASHRFFEGVLSTDVSIAYMFSSNTQTEEFHYNFL